MSNLQGGCLCQAIRYEINGQPDERMQLTCHCRDCQQVTGAGHARSMGVPMDAVTWRGEPMVYHIQHESSVVDSAFCGRCGSPIYKKTSKAPEVVFFHVGSLDPSSGAGWRSKVTAFGDRRQPWDVLVAIEEGA